VIVREISKPVLLSVFPKVYTGRHVTHPAVLLVRTAKVTITLDRDMTIYGGGELIGATHVAEHRGRGDLTYVCGSGSSQIAAGGFRGRGEGHFPRSASGSFFQGPTSSASAAVRASARGRTVLDSATALTYSGAGVHVH